MIEFNCKHCGTTISIAVEQIGYEVFCPACEKETDLPELSPEMEEQLHIALAQANTGPIKKIDPAKVKKLLEEPDSKETKEWKENLAKSFQSKTLNKVEREKEKSNLNPPEKKEVESKKSTIRKIFDLFPKK